jgi:hypothetical protein
LRTWVTIRAITGHVEAEINWEGEKGGPKRERAKGRGPEQGEGKGEGEGEAGEKGRAKRAVRA